MQRKDPAGRWVVVTAKVEITGDTTRSGLGELVRLSEVDGVATGGPAVVLLRDGTRVDRLNPGMEEELAFAWEQGAGATPPKEVTVQIAGGSPTRVPVTTP